MPYQMVVVIAFNGQPVLALLKIIDGIKAVRIISDHKDIIACPAGEVICAQPAGQDIIPAAAIDNIASVCQSCPDKDIILIIAGQVIHPPRRADNMFNAAENCHSVQDCCCLGW